MNIIGRIWKMAQEARLSTLSGSMVRLIFVSFVINSSFKIAKIQKLPWKIWITVGISVLKSRHSEAALWPQYCWDHYSDVIMGTIASQISSLTIDYSTVYSDADQRKHQRSASLAFVRGIHRWPVNSPHKGHVTRKMFPFDDVIMTAGMMVSYLQVCLTHWPQGNATVLSM